MNESKHISRLYMIVVMVSTVTLPSGCKGPLDTLRNIRGSVPDNRLRQIETLELETAEDQSADEVDVDTKAVEPASELKLTLEEARSMAMKHNLEIQVQLINPTIARESISEEEARFESLFIGNVNFSKTDTPVATNLAGSLTNSRSLGAGLSIPLKSGGSITLDTPVDRFETNNAFSILNPSYTTDVRASIDQPLARGGGILANTYAIRVATYQSQSTEARTKLEIIRILAAVDRLYWRLYAAHRELEVRKKEYELAQVQQERARRQVEAGVSPEVEVIRAASGVADRVEAIIVADNAIQDRERELKRVLNRPGLDISSATVIIPTTEPNQLRYTLTQDRLVNEALKNRMEILELELQIAQDASAIDFARNQTLPLVMLNYTYKVNGLGPAANDAFDLLFEKRFEDHLLGLRVEVPLGNEAAKSRLRREIATRLQTLSRFKQRTVQIKQEALNAADQLEATWQRIVANRQRRALAERTLAAEVRQFQIGSNTSTDVLDAQTRLAQAVLAEIVALTEYQITQVDLAFATGTILGSAKIRWQPIDEIGMPP